MYLNSYPEDFKIKLVKEYLHGKKKVEICSEYGIAKSTFWGWICKYQNLIFKEWKIEEPVVSDNEAFVDIRPAAESAIKSTVIQGSKDIVRIFINGYAIVCDITNLKSVLRMINND